MLLPTHLAAGYLTMHSLKRANEKLFSKTLLIVGVLAAIAPDIDGLRPTAIATHRTFPHAPLFWITVCAAGFLLAHLKYNKLFKTITVVVLINVAGHLVLDWFSGRTAGIPLLWPFDARYFNLFPIDPSKGQHSLWQPTKEYFAFYLQNKWVAATEILILVSGCVLWLKQMVREKSRTQHA
jgi:general stress protein CsbA